jgi:hypothetical protein
VTVAVALGEKSGAPIVAQVRNARAAQREQENSRDHGGSYLINRNLPFAFNASPILHPSGFLFALRNNSYRLAFTAVLPQPYMQIC